jgi:hypothetical protein
MTREQAHNELQNKVKRSPHNNNYYHGGDLQGLVDQIFDDSESRTCGNCKHYTEDNKRDICMEGVIENYNFLDEQYYDLTKDFGCNKWEQK